MKPDGIEAPVGPVLGTPRRIGDRTRIALVAAVAVVVVAVGFGLAGNGFAPGATGSPPASPSGIADASATAGATTPPSPEPSLPAPTPNTALGCAPERNGQAPEIRLQADATGSSIGGVAGPPSDVEPASPGPSVGPGALPANWPSLPPTGALRAPTGTVVLTNVDGGCMRYVVAEYAPATAAGASAGVAYPIPFRNLNIIPPLPAVTLGSLPDGDWAVRVVAYFSTGQAGADGQLNTAVIERFFRVVAGSGAIVTPVVTPVVPCGTMPADGSRPDLVLYGASGEAGDGPTVGLAPGTGPPPILQAQLGDPLEIRAAGGACAVAWKIEAFNADANRGFEYAAQVNPDNDPFYARQDRWPLDQVDTGVLQITATMTFSADVIATGRWTVVLAPPELPYVAVSAPDGTLAEATIACGSTWQFPSGASGSQVCPNVTDLSFLEVLAVAPGTPVRVDASDWTIAAWSGSCGRIDAAANPFEPFVQVNNCDLGGSTVAGPVFFVTRSDGPVVRLHLTLERDGVVMDATAYVRTAPPGG